MIVLAGWRDLATARHLTILPEEWVFVEQSIADADYDGPGNRKCLERG